MKPERQGPAATSQQGCGAAQGAVDAAYPQALREAEGQLLQQRHGGKPAAALGLGLSGGGIRSATFALGLFQAMARSNPELLRRLDYLSTVSGGGYFGACYGRLMQRLARQAAAAPPDPEEQASDPAAAEASDGRASLPPGLRQAADALAGQSVKIGGQQLNLIGWLRENGRYMAPRGSGDFFTGAGVVLRNLVTVHIVMGLTAIALFALLQWPVSLWFWHVDPEPWLLGGSFQLSPLILLPAFCALIVCLPLGWAYWLLREEPEVKADKGDWRGRLGGQARWELNPWVGWVATLLLLALFGYEALEGGGALLWTGLLLLVATLLAGMLAARKMRSGGSLQEQRADLTRGFGRSLLLLAVLVWLALVDSLGQNLYLALVQSESRAWLGGLLGALTAAGAAGRRLVTMLEGPVDGPGVKGLLWKLGPWLLAAILLLFVPALYAALTDAFAAKFASPEPAGGPPPTDGVRLAVIGLASGLLALCFGRTWTFLNLSSLSGLYAARLTQAYLGASNPRRHDPGTPQELQVTGVVAEDDILAHEYWPPAGDPYWAAGGPLHLINVTVNETVDGRSQVQRQDRKGTGLAVGPAGLSLGVRHHVLAELRKQRRWPQRCLPDEGFRVFAYDRGQSWEELTLGQWVAISGAAFSTGLGWRTNTGLSLLLGLSNVRMGYWWDSGRPAARSPQGAGEDSAAEPGGLGALASRLFPVQGFLLGEWLARFHGPARHQYWNLSDGGHFENLGGYELIRRRLPFIIISDAECDPDYRGDGLAGLVHKARVDFGAEIEFPENPATLPGVGKLADAVGSLRALMARDKDGFNGCLAALGQVRYPDEPQRPPSWLLYIKPSLRADAPVDVRNYRQQNPAFPQQTTADQFFDDMQWESYRKLGEWIGTQVLKGQWLEAAMSAAENRQTGSESGNFSGGESS